MFSCLLVKKIPYHFANNCVKLVILHSVIESTETNRNYMYDTTKKNYLSTFNSLMLKTLLHQKKAILSANSARIFGYCRLLKQTPCWINLASKCNKITTKRCIYKTYYLIVKMYFTRILKRLYFIFAGQKKKNLSPNYNLLTIVPMRLNVR